MNHDVTLPSDTRSPIFIGGQRRSGTTLMRVLLNRHPHIACGRESHFAGKLEPWHDPLAEEWSETVRRYGFGPEAVERAFAALADHLFTRYQLAEGKQRWAEKTPSNILRIDYLFRLFPQAQFIHVIRDPRDTFCSIRERAQTDRPAWNKYSSGYSARNWRAGILAGKRWRAYPDRYHEVRYEELVREPEATLRRVLAFLNEPWAPQILDPDADNSEARRLELKKRDRIFATSIGRWRTELNGAEVAEIESIAGELMVALGYELASSAGPDAPSLASTTGERG
jgi:Sulfotransferase family